MITKEPKIKKRTTTDTAVSEIAVELIEGKGRGNTAWIYLGEDTFTGRSAVNDGPNLGSMHLAQLVSQGYIDTIFTTCKEFHVENALYKVLPPEQICIISSSLIPAPVISRILASSPKDVINVIKLEDQSSVGSFHNMSTADILDAIVPSTIPCGLIFAGVAAADLPLVKRLVGSATGRVYYVSAVSLNSAKLNSDKVSKVAPLQPSAIIADATVKIENYEDFISTLNLHLQKTFALSNSEKLLDIETSILRQHEEDGGVVTHSDIGYLSREMGLKITKAKPDILYILHDANLPVGIEVHRQLKPLLDEEKIELKLIDLSSDISRQNVSFAPQAGAKSAYNHVMVLDAVAFSGNTLRLAGAILASKYPTSAITLAALMVSRQLAEESDAKVLFQRITDRFEIIFPWGVARTTKNISRQFKRLDNGSRIVDIYSRPWGMIEVLADQEPCSIRILTLHANRRLSFQRHLCRDEFFLALDDDTCIELYSGQVNPDAHPVEHQIRSLSLKKGDYVLVPRGMWHRTKATSSRGRLLEVAFGPYDQAMDIERRWDDYGRSKQDGSK